MNFSGNDYKRIAVIRLSSLGDIVHTIPAFNLLRKQFPHAQISWFVEPQGAELLTLVTGIDKIVVLDLKAKGLLKKFKEIKKVLSLYRKTFDLVIDFQGLLKSAVLARLLKGETIGFNKKNLKEPLARHFYRHQASLFDETRHVILKNIHILRDLLPGGGSAVQYPLKPLPMSPRLNDFLEKNKLEKNNYVIINVGGGWESKLMSTAQYVGIINGIKKNHYHIVILWGNEKEKAAAEEISSQTGTSISNFFNFSELILFIRCSRLIVSGDTLGLHLADMVGKPSVGIFGPTSPWRNGSLLKKSVHVYEKLPCSFCYKKKCGTIDCINKISAEKVINAIERVYEA
jgi:lipopolysaccharide heptosyltransferase I